MSWSFPGALTPTEVMAAWKAGADFVKVFPCSANGGPGYIQALKAPFPEVPLIASGGVNQMNAVDFHSRGRGGAGHRAGSDPPGCDQAPRARLDHRTGAQVSGYGAPGAGQLKELVA